MTDAAAISSIPLVTIADGKSQDDSLPVYSLFQSGTHINAESNVRVEATAGSVDRTSESPQCKKQKRSGSKAKMDSFFYFDSANPPERVCWVQTDSYADTWTPFVNGNMVSDIEKQEWDAVFSSVAKMKIRCRHMLVPPMINCFDISCKHKQNLRQRSQMTSESPQCKKQKRSGSKSKMDSFFYFDSANPPERMCLVQTDSYANTWTPFVNGNMVSDIEKQEWDAVFSSVAKMKIGKKQTGKK